MMVGKARLRHSPSPRATRHVNPMTPIRTLIVAAALLATPLALPSAPAALAPAFVRIVHDMDTGFTLTGTFGMACLSLDVSHGSVEARCILDGPCLSLAGVSVVDASATQGIDAGVLCGISSAGCTTYFLGVNNGACASPIDPKDLTPSNDVECAAQQADLATSVLSAPKGVYTLTCTFF
jgi:hypothetical protein